MVRWYNDQTVLINDYSGTQHADYWKKMLGRVLKKHGLNTIPVPYIETERKNKDGIESAAGCYINYLQINELIFLPQFGIPQDQLALDVFNQLKPWTIIPVDCSEIAEAGGVLNCMTWNYNLK
jgi:agmatine deiminase